MTIFRNKKDGLLYLLYMSQRHYAGRITAEAYAHFGPTIFNAKMANFEPVATR